MNMGKLESLQINPRPAGVKPGQTKNERQPPASGYQEDWDSLPVGQCRSARPIRPGCQSVKAGKTKFTGSWSNRVCYNSFQINGRPPWVKPGQTKMNANHQPRALEKPASHRKATRIGQPVPAGQAVCRSKQVKPNSQVHGKTTSVINPCQSTIRPIGSNPVKPKMESQIQPDVVGRIPDPAFSPELRGSAARPGLG